MAKIHIGVRVDRTLADRIDGLVGHGGRTKTDVIERALRAGIDQLEEQDLAQGFALLGDSTMQDMMFPTGAQTEAVRIAD